jgi:hypothetical protein
MKIHFQEQQFSATFSLPQLFNNLKSIFTPLFHCNLAFRLFNNSIFTRLKTSIAFELIF